MKAGETAEEMLIIEAAERPATTSDVIVNRRRTSAATAARQRRKTEKLVMELSPRLEHLDGEWLAALLDVVLGELEARRDP